MTLAERLRDRLARPAAGGLLRGDWDFAFGTEPPGRTLTPAAVLMPIIDRGEPTLLLTQRNASLRKHAGQVAFPGGRVDPEDAGPVEAALREAMEEVALPPAAVQVLGVSDRYETGTGYAITPVVGLVQPDLPLVAAEAEVADLFEVPLAYMLDPANHQLREAEWKGRQRRFYVIEVAGREVWGATAGMIVNLARRLA